MVCSRILFESGVFLQYFLEKLVRDCLKKKYKNGIDSLECEIIFLACAKSCLKCLLRKKKTKLCIAS